MKRILLTFLFLFCFVPLVNAGTSICGGRPAAGGAAAGESCTIGSGTGWDCSASSPDDYWTLGTGNYQLKAFAEETEICKVVVMLWSTSGAGTASVSVWDSTKTVQYGSTSGVVNITDSGNPGTLYEFTFETNPVVPAADIRIYVNAESGTVNANSTGSGDNTCFGGTDYDGNFSGTIRDEDYIMGIYYMH